MHFRPEDPYAHPAWGEQRPCNGFLLKIAKEDVKKDSLPESRPVLAASDACLPEACPALCADIVARVSESYCFNGKDLALQFLGCLVDLNFSYIVSFGLKIHTVLSFFPLIHVGIAKAWPTTSMLFLFMRILHSRGRENGWR